MVAVDLNCDLGEGGGEDAQLMPWITSANIACGGHAGDETTMRAALALAGQHGVGAGAHPGYEDRDGFGRKDLELPTAVLESSITRQLAALAACGDFQHVKPHGALYNRAAVDVATAEAVVAAVRGFNPRLLLVGLAGSVLVRVGQDRGLNVREEAFVDRAYLADGRLAPRTLAGAVHAVPETMVAQALSIVRHGEVTTIEGARLALRADTLCLHGDGPGAAAAARALREALKTAGVWVRPMVQAGRNDEGTDQRAATR